MYVQLNANKRAPAIERATIARLARSKNYVTARAIF